MTRMILLIILFTVQFSISSSALFAQFPLPNGQRLIVRGVNVPEGIGNSDIDKLATWGVNVIRWQLFCDRGDLNQKLAHLQNTLVPRCRMRGIGIIIDMHEPPRGRFKGGKVNGLYVPHQYEGQHRFMRTNVARNEFIATWSDISLRFRNEPVIVGYDLCNEPAGTYEQWRPIARMAIETIRSQNDQKTIIVKTPYGNPDLLNNFVPFRPMHGRIVYSVHFYEPQSFTDPRGTGRTVGSYPNNNQLNIAWLRRRLLGVRNFARTHQAHVLIGEFSATKGYEETDPPTGRETPPAQGGDLYLDELISIFENEGFSWCYHIYKEADVWRIDAQREQMLRRWFAKN